MREHFHKPVRDGNGALLLHATVRIIDPETNENLDPVKWPLWTDEEGEAQRLNPTILDEGVIDFYLDRAKVVDIGITPEGSTAETILRNQSVGDVDIVKETYTFTLVGAAGVRVGTLRFYIEEPCEIDRVRVSTGVAPQGQDLIVDVNLNGTSIFTDATRPRVAPGMNTGYVDPATPVALVAGDYLSIDIDQIGTTSPGADLVVQVRVRRQG